jgi:UDP-glucuronate decarboxylase
MRVLVTGGAGFVGSHLVERLLGQGHEVTCFDNLYTGRLSNLARLTKEKALTVVFGDVCEPYDFAVDRIYNLASPASPVHYQRDPVYTARTNLLGAMNVLELARRTGARVLQASTSEIYGDPLVHPQPETYWGNVNPIGPRSCYDESKRAAETLFADYSRFHGVDVRVARIFNTYGPRMRREDGRVVSNFIVQALRDEPLSIYGDGIQTRSFCFVSDLVEGLLRLMESDVDGPVNIGNPAEFTMRQLATKVIALAESASQIEYRELPIDDPRQRQPDISIARQRLGWSPTVTLEEGLDLTIEYFRSVTNDGPEFD